MNIDETVFWIDGFLSDKNGNLTSEETKILKKKIDECFNKVTPRLIPFKTYNPNEIIKDFGIC